MDGATRIRCFALVGFVVCFTAKETVSGNAEHAKVSRTQTQVPDTAQRSSPLSHPSQSPSAKGVCEKNTY